MCLLSQWLTGYSGWLVTVVDWLQWLVDWLPWLTSYSGYSGWLTGYSGWLDTVVIWRATVVDWLQWLTDYSGWLATVVDRLQWLTHSGDVSAVRAATQEKQLQIKFALSPVHSILANKSKRRSLESLALSHSRTNFFKSPRMTRADKEDFDPLISLPREGLLTTELLVVCLTSKQHASVSHGPICSENCACCHTEIEAAHQTFYLTQSRLTDTGPTSPSADPITPGAWQSSHWSANFEVNGMTRPANIPLEKLGLELWVCRSKGGRLNH